MAEKKPIAKEATAGQPVQVILQSMVGSTGYGWQMTSLAEGLGLMTAEIKPSSLGIGPVNHIFNFLALKVGTCKVKFQLIRPWIPAEPAETVEYEFTIKAQDKTAAEDIATAMKGAGFVGAPAVNVGAEAYTHPIHFYGIPCVTDGGKGPQTLVPDYGIPTMDTACCLKYGIPTTSPMECLKYGMMCVPQQTDRNGGMGMQPPQVIYGTWPPMCPPGGAAGMGAPPPTVNCKYGITVWDPNCMTDYGIYPACRADAQKIGTAMQGFVGAPPVGTGAQTYSTTMPILKYGYYGECQNPAQNIGTAMQGFVGAQSPMTPVVMSYYGYPSVCLPMCPPGGTAGMGAQAPAPPYGTMPQCNGGNQLYGMNPICQQPAAQNIGPAMQGFVGAPGAYNTMMPYACPPMGGAAGAQGPMPLYGTWPPYWGPVPLYGIHPACQAGGANPAMGAQGPMVPYGTWPPYCG